MTTFRLNRRSLLSIASAAAWPGSASMAAVPDATPYALPHTAVHDAPDPKTGRRYQLWVDLPASVADGGNATAPLPVVFLTDAPYGFPLVRSIRARVGQAGRNLEDFILVGLAPAAGEDSALSRARDYTPTDPRRRAQRGTDTYAGQAYGEAARYRDYLATVALPLLQGLYRVDMARSTYIGHSYGGLFGAYVMLTAPALFSRYALGSPSLWFDRRVMFEIEAAYAASHADLPTQLMMYCGAYETLRPGPRYFKTGDMVRDIRDFERVLRSRHYKSLKLGSQVIADEDHFTVFPSLVTRALLWALPGRGPYISG